MRSAVFASLNALADQPAAARGRIPYGPVAAHQPETADRSARKVGAQRHQARPVCGVSAVQLGLGYLASQPFQLICELDAALRRGGLAQRPGQTKPSSRHVRSWKANAPGYARGGKVNREHEEDETRQQPGLWVGERGSWPARRGGVRLASETEATGDCEWIGRA